MTKFARLLPILWACVAMFASTACSKDDDNNNFYESKASLLHDVVIWEATATGGQQTRIVLEGNPKTTYRAVIVEGDFASFDLNSKMNERTGSVGQLGLYLYLDANTGDEERQATIRITYSDNTLDETLYLTQQAYAAGARYDLQQWPELPQYRSGSDYIYKTYYTTLTTNPQKVRNYSICFDTKKRVSLWVAYPIHGCYLSPNLSRVDTFGYDPNDQLPYISQEVQQHIVDKAYGTGHSRGHMLPNASRMNNYATNAMTFYATNMMPQHGGFNSGIWATLEGKVREVGNKATTDTLYVVTGTYFGDDYTIQDRMNKTIAVPSHAYKVLLKAKKAIPAGQTIADLEASDLQAIGFWYANPKLNEKSSGTLTSGACTVEEIEAKTGFDYFKMLKPEVAAEVKKSYKLSDWGI